MILHIHIFGDNMPANNAMILENSPSKQDDSVRVEYRRLCLLLEEWQREKGTNQHNMARYADRVITVIQYEISYNSRKFLSGRHL